MIFPSKAAKSRITVLFALFGAASLVVAQDETDIGRAISRQQNPGFQQGFGVNGFSNSPMERGGTALPNGNINSLVSDQTPYLSDFPLVDSLYRVGPGDIFQIHYEFTSLEKQVTPEGYILMNRIGIVRLEGLTLREAKKRILDKLATAYRREDCFVGLSRPKDMRVFVTGAVNMPGTYHVQGNFRLSDAIKIAGGFSAAAQKGEIGITAGNRTQQINLKKFIVEGDLTSNPYLPQGAVVQIPYLDYTRPWITVRRSGESFSIQIEKGETLSDAVLKSYGFTPPPPYSALLVKEWNGRDSLVSGREASGYHPDSGAYVEVIPARQEIFVAGAVSAPGGQPHVSERRIIQYISSSGLLTSSRLPEKIEVVRINGERIKLPVQSSDLRPGDVLFVRQNAEQKFLIYTPILLSFVSLSLAVITVFGMN